MDTKKIEAFLKTIELGSMNKAAEHLNYTQTGLLYMIKTLEQDLGAKLLIRTSQGVSLTKAGQELKPIMEETVESGSRLMDRANAISLHQRTSLRIAAYPVFMRFQMPKAINRFMEEYPDTDIDMHTGAEEELLNLLMDEVIDLAIGEPADKKAFSWRPLAEDEIYAAIPAKIDNNQKERISIEDLLDYPIIFSGNNPFHDRMDSLLAGRAQAQGRVKVTSLDSSILLSMMENQKGIMFLSHMYSKVCPDSVHMYPLDPPVVRKLGILTKKKAALSEAAKAFIQYLEEWARGAAPAE